MAWTIPADDKENIDEAVQSLGHPAAFEDQFRYRASSGDMKGEIRETLTYGYGRTISDLFVAGTAISIIAAFLGLPQITVMGLAVFIYNTVSGIYQLADSARFSKYDVYIIYWRKAYINDEYVRLATWQVRWYAYVGSTKATLSEYVNNKGAEYKLSNSAFLKLAFDNY